MPLAPLQQQSGKDFGGVTVSNLRYGKCLVHYLRIVPILALTTVLSLGTFDHTGGLPFELLGAAGFLLLGAYTANLIHARLKIVQPLVFLPSVVFLSTLLLYYPGIGVDKYVFGRSYRFMENEDILYFQTMLLAWVAVLAFQAGYGTLCADTLHAHRGVGSRIEGLSQQLERFRLGPLLIAGLTTVGFAVSVLRLPLGPGAAYIAGNLPKWALYLVIMYWLCRPSPLSALAALMIGGGFFVVQLAKVNHNRAETLIPFVALLAMWNIVQWRGHLADHTTRKPSALGAWSTPVLMASSILAVFVVLSQIRFLGRTTAVPAAELHDFLVTFFPGLDTTMKILMEVPRYADYLHGRSLFVVAYQFVPSRLWPTKPLGGADAWLTSYLYGFDPTITLAIPTIVAELYWNFGYWTVPVGMVGVGWLFRKLDRGLSNANSFVDIMFYASLAPLAVHLVRGPFGNCVFRLVSDLVPFLLVLLSLRVSKRTARTKGHGVTRMVGSP